MSIPVDAWAPVMGPSTAINPFNGDFDWAAPAGCAASPPAVESTNANATAREPNRTLPRSMSFPPSSRPLAWRLRQGAPCYCPGDRNGGHVGARPARLTSSQNELNDQAVLVLIVALTSWDYSADKMFRPRTLKVTGSEDEAVKPGPAAVSACA